MDRGFQRWPWIVATLFVLGTGVGQSPAGYWPGATAVAGRQSAADLPPFTSEVTFLYFDDVDRATAFYEGTLGLEKTFDAGWVRIFATPRGHRDPLRQTARGRAGTPA